jgi:hypothetical protein
MCSEVAGRLSYRDLSQDTAAGLPPGVENPMFLSVLLGWFKCPVGFHKCPVEIGLDQCFYKHFHLRDTHLHKKEKKEKKEEKRRKKRGILL